MYERRSETKRNTWINKDWMNEKRHLKCKRKKEKSEIFLKKMEGSVKQRKKNREKEGKQ